MPSKDDKYQSALDYLYSFVDYSLTRQLRYSADKFDLSRMYHLMSMLGDPQNKYPVVHIAGTKGKGSTAAMLASILQTAGYKVGLYTSPHLQDYTERIQINSNPISRKRLVREVNRFKDIIPGIKGISTFEITTAIAFEVFANEKVDIAVVEVGLGGRLDATNVVNPLVSVITSLSFDHMNVLGDSIKQIAAEKGGIIKTGRPVVLSLQWQEAREVIERICTQKNCSLTMIGRDYFFSTISHSLDGQTFWVWAADEQDKVNQYIKNNIPGTWEPERYTTPLLGLHQVENAATVRAVIEILRTCGFNISKEAIRNGFRNVKWPARFEIVNQNPLIIVDSAHNKDSALRLRLAIDDYLDEKPITLIFGASEDKDIQGMFSHLLPRVNQVVATKSEHPRAMDPERIVELASQFGRKVIQTGSVEEALAVSIKGSDENSVILVAGSIFIAAAARGIVPGLKNSE